MQLHLTFERETENTVRFAQDEEGHLERCPRAAVVGTRYLPELAWAHLGKPEQIAASLEAQGPTGAR